MIPVKAAALSAVRALFLMQLVVVLPGPAQAAPSVRLAEQGAQQARGLWAAEWLREGVDGRTLGFLRLRDGKLSFAAQSGAGGWELVLADVKKVARSDDRSFTVESVTGETYVMAAMEANLLPMSPKKVVKALEDALKDARSSQIEWK